MIRLNKVRPYVASTEESFALELYDHEQKFELVIKQQSIIPVVKTEIIYDGGGVWMDEDGDEVIFDGTADN